MKAAETLRAAAAHIENRAVARDTPAGERSMARTVRAFNALTGHDVSERDGWLFMVVLKAARACNTATGQRDDYEDLAAYAALAGETLPEPAVDTTLWRLWNPHAEGARVGPKHDSCVHKAIRRDGMVLAAHCVNTWDSMPLYPDAEIVGYTLEGDV